MSSDSDFKAASRLGSGYLLWAACGAGLRFPDHVKIPWVVTSAIGDGQIDAFERAVSSFRIEQDASHAVARAAYEEAKSQIKGRPKYAPAGFEDEPSEDIQKLREKAQMTCHPILGEMMPSYDRILQTIQFSKFGSSGVIDRGAGRSAILEGRKPYAVKHFTTDPVLRVMRSNYCETQVRSAGGGAVVYKAIGRRSFYAMTVVQSMDKTRENLAEIAPAAGGMAVPLDGFPGSIPPGWAQEVRTRLDRIHTKSENPIEVSVEKLGDWFCRIPDLGLTKFAMTHIERQQRVCSWDSLRSLVIGVMAAEKALEADGCIVFEESDIPVANELLKAAALNAYGAQIIEKFESTSATRAENARKAREASAAKREAEVPGLAAELRKAIQKAGPMFVSDIIRGDSKIMTKAQLDLVLSTMTREFGIGEDLKVKLIRDTTPSDPTVVEGVAKLASQCRQSLQEGRKPWVMMDSKEFEAVSDLWHDMVRYAEGNALCINTKQGKAAVILKDKEGWIARWPFYPEVKSKADESGITIEDNDQS